MLRAVTFDFTGTLVSTPRLGEIYSEVLGRHGVEVTPERAAALMREVWRELDCLAHPARDRFAAHPGGARGWWARLLERLCERLEAGELYDRFARADAWRLYPEALETLAELRRRGFAVGLISNWDERLPGLLADLGLAEHLDVTVYSQEVGFEKPHPGIFEAALGRLDLPPVRVLHVGDRRRKDVEGARAIGMRALLLDRSGGGGDLPEVSDVFRYLLPGG